MSRAAIRAVVLDGFGTLVEIGMHRRPFGRLIKWLRANHVPPAENEAAWLMSRNVDLAGVAAATGATLPSALLAELEHDLAIELASIRAFADTRPALHRLRARGLGIGVCSNLAAPYAPPLLRLLPFPPDAAVLSFAVGAIKPEPAIYHAVCAALACAPAEVLFVGDTRAADVEGPRAFGMQALHLVRNGTGGTRAEGCIRSLAEIDGWLEGEG